VASYSLIGGYKRFGGTYKLHLQDTVLSVFSCETLVFYQTTTVSYPRREQYDIVEEVRLETRVLYLRLQQNLL
jgi:hypothetical protein